ncbi:MAG TPA: hypothetical protein VFF67_03425 [Thermoplasmata archaeon]|nr:hypothetical protein [Thermoplasmata archaeon]
MTLPPAPNVPAPEGLPPSADVRRCSSCRTPLEALGPRPFRTAAFGAIPEAVVTFELYFCPQCGKVEFFSSR